jgi:hypothetical protein
MRIGRLIATTATAGLAALIFATPALANSTIHINPGNVPTTAEGFDSHECDKNFGGGPFPGQDVWVFVLPGNHDTSGDFVSLTANFSGNVTVTITAAANPNNFSNGGPQTSKAFIVTTAGLTLLSATAEITGTAKFFNLTHTCPAKGSPSPSHSPKPSKSPTPSPSASETTAPPTSAPPSTAPTTGAVPSGAAPTGGGGSFTLTGMGIGTISLASGAAIALILLRRRRDNSA